MKQKYYSFFVNFSPAEMETQTDVYLVSLSPDTQQARKKYLSNPKNVREESDLIQESNPGPPTWKWVGLRGHVPSGRTEAWEGVGAPGSLSSGPSRLGIDQQFCPPSWTSLSDFSFPFYFSSLISLSSLLQSLSSCLECLNPKQDRLGEGGINFQGQVPVGRCLGNRESPLPG